MKNDIKWIIGVIFIPIIIAIGFFNIPNIKTTQYFYENSPCSNQIYSYFDISFSNIGSAGTNLCVSLNSPENISFTQEQKCSWINNNGEPTKFRLDIDESSIKNLNNFTIICNYTYNKFFIKSVIKSINCNYRKEKYGSRFKLIA